MEISKQKLLIKLSYEKGYRVVDNNVISSKGRILKTYNKDGYNAFSVYYNKRSNVVLMHRLMAYQKYKNEYINTNQVVRHLDGNKHNNTNENILLGTVSQNNFDKPKELRLKMSINAANKLRRFTDIEVDKIKQLRLSGKTYEQIIDVYPCSKSTIRHVIKNNYVTTKI